MLQGLTQDTLLKAQQALLDVWKQGALTKTAVDLATGLTGYNLEAPSKILLQNRAPFRQTISRKVIGGIGTNWKRITAVARAGTFKSAEGTKSAGFTMTVDTKTATFGSCGLLGDVTWEARKGGQNYEDVRARAETLTLEQVLVLEELTILGGHTTDYGAGPTPTVVAATSGGALADATYYVMVVALSMLGAKGASRIARPTRGTNNYTFASVPTLSLVDGVGAVSAEGSAAVSGGSGAGKITITFTPLATAAAYAIFIGTTTGAANLKLQGIVTQSTVVVTAINTTGALASTLATDTSGDAPYLGIQGQLAAAGSGAYVKRVNGAFSAVVGRGIPEIEDGLNDVYDRTGVEPDRLVMGWTELEDIDNKMASVTSDRVKLNISLSPTTDPGASLPRFTTYKSGRGKVIQLEENPNIPGGMILGLIDSVPYPNSEIPAAWQMHMAADFERIDYATTAPKEEFEIRGFGALAGYAPALQALWYDIKEA